MKKLLFAPVLFVFGYSLGFAQASGNAIYSKDYDSPAPMAGVDLSLNNYSFSFNSFLEANVMINVKASAYTAIFSLTQNGKTIEETETLMQNRIDLFTKKLEEHKVNTGKTFTDPVSLVPSYEAEITEKRFSKTVNEIPSGFEMKKNIHVTFTVQTEINNIIAAAAEAEVYDLVKVDYTIDNLDTILNQARQEAIRILLIKQKAIEKAGIYTRFIQTGERYGSVYPLERYAQYYAYKTGMNRSYTVNYRRNPQQVKYNYADKNQTVYYEKVPDKQFDKVINPAVAEPVVQVYITVKAQYATYDPATEEAAKLHDQKVKELQLKEMELRLEEKKAEIALLKRGIVINNRKTDSK